MANQTFTIEFNGKTVKLSELEPEDLIRVRHDPSKYGKPGEVLKHLTGELGRRRLSKADIIDYVEKHPELGIPANEIGQY